MVERPRTVRSTDRRLRAPLGSSAGAGARCRGLGRAASSSCSRLERGSAEVADLSSARCCGGPVHLRSGPLLLWMEAGAEMAFPANIGGQLWFLLRHHSHLSQSVPASSPALLSAWSFLHTHLPTTHPGNPGLPPSPVFLPSNSPPHSTSQSVPNPLPFSFQSPPANSLLQPKPQGDDPEPGTSLAPLHVSLPLPMHHPAEKRLC